MSAEAPPYEYTIQITDVTKKAKSGCVQFLCKDSNCITSQTLIDSGFCNTDLSEKCGPDACGFLFNANDNVVHFSNNINGVYYDIVGAAVFVDSIPRNSDCSGIGNIYPEFTLNKDAKNSVLDVSLVDYVKGTNNFQQFSMFWNPRSANANPIGTRACNLMEAKYAGVFPPTCTDCNAHKGGPNCGRTTPYTEAPCHTDYACEKFNACTYRQSCQPMIAPEFSSGTLEIFYYGISNWDAKQGSNSCWDAPLKNPAPPAPALNAKSCNNLGGWC